MPRFSVAGAPPNPPPLHCFLLQKPSAMGATGAGGDDWERKKGEREEGRPWGETKPSPGERFSRFIARQNNQTEA